MQVCVVQTLLDAGMAKQLDEAAIRVGLEVNAALEEHKRKKTGPKADKHYGPHPQVCPCCLS